MARAEIRVYEDPKDDSFNKSGLPDAQKDAYDEGWDEGMSQEDQLSSMTKEDFERKLGEATKIVNFNGQMTLFENQAFNGKMTEYVLSQIMYGYAPASLGIGYEVNIVDWVQNPNPEEYVVVSSSETLPPELAAPTIQMAKGHWTLFLRKENLEMFQPPEVSAAMLGLAEDYEMMGEISEVNLDVVDFESLRKYISRDVLIKGRGELYVRPADGELLKMESPERGWRKVERIKVMGDKFDSILPEVARWAMEKKGFSVASATATEVTITAESSAQAEKLAKALNKTGLLTAQVSGESVQVNY
jgi:hypothetical protein